VRIVADEGIERQIVEALRTEGYPVVYFGEEAPGSADLDVLALARESEVLLLTSDKDFGELVFRQRLASAGVVLLRLHGLPAASKVTIVITALTAHGLEMAGAFTVVSPGLLRIRPLEEGRH
jgi:predicted nuclease of predicted toxin-antitoxin system